MKPSVFGLSVSLLFFTSNLFSAEKEASNSWIRLTRPGMELFTDSASAEAQHLLQVLDPACSGGSAFGFDMPKSAKTLRIIAFANESEYSEFRLHPASTGHYLHTGNRDYIVLPDLRSNHLETAVHEFTHYLVNRSGLHLPLWLNEGMADLYSSKAFDGGAGPVGGLLTGRLSTLSSASQLAVEQIFSWNRESEVSADPKALSALYAESWALTRMLAASPEFAPHFDEFLAQLSNGLPSSAALYSVYRLAESQLDEKFVAYKLAMRTEKTVHSWPTSSGHCDAAISSTVSSYESELVRADLLAAHPSTVVRAKRSLLELAKSFGEKTETEELLGYLAWKSKDYEEAKLHWSKAVERGSDDLDTLNRYAVLLHDAGAAPSQVVPILKKAAEANPEDDETTYNLGVIEYQDRQYKAASETLLGIRAVRPQRAYAYFSVLAYCKMQMKDYGQAQAFLDKARESARTPDQQAENSRMQQFASARAD